MHLEIDFSVGPHDLYIVKCTISDIEGRHGYWLSAIGTTDGGYVSESGYDQQKIRFRHDYYGEMDSFKTIFSHTNLNQETAGYIPGFKAYQDESFSRTNPNPEAYCDAKLTQLSTE